MAPPRPNPASASLLKLFLLGPAVPTAALGVVAVAAVLYLTGLLAEGPAAALLALVVALSLAVFMVRPALASSVDPFTRGVAALIAAAAGLLCALSAVSAVVPGPPAAQGEVSRVGDRIELPPGSLGAGSRLRLLVHAPLPPGGTPVVEFRFTGGAGPLEGKVERTVSYARVGRGGRAAVAHDRNEVWVHGTVGAGVTALTLDRVDGAVAGPLHVAVHGEWLSPLALWLGSLLVLAVAAVWDARLRGGHFAALAGMALAYGLLVQGNATPSAAVGTSIGAVLLGALAGAMAGGLMALLARLVLRSPELADVAPGGKGGPRTR